MARGLVVAVLLQLAVCSLAVSIQYAPGGKDGEAANSDSDVTDLGDLEEIDTVETNSAPASFADYIVEEAPRHDAAQLAVQGANASVAADAAVAQDAAAADAAAEEADVSRFTVEIEMPHSKESAKEPQAKLMGWKLGNEEGKPIQIAKIKSKGMLAKHNSGNDEKLIVAGDELVEVNGVKYTGDTRAFEVALGKEIQASMKKGGPPALRLTVQRRRQAEQAPKALAQETAQTVEAAAQDTSIHRVEVEENANSSAGTEEKTQISEEKTNGSADVQSMAYDLLEAKAAESAVTQAHQVELSVSKVEGLIAAWNKLHPEDPIELDHEMFRKAMGVSLVMA